jgi:hypothetical protein
MCSAQCALGRFGCIRRCAHPKLRFSAREMSTSLLQHRLARVPRTRCVDGGQRRHRLDSYSSRVKRASPRSPSYAYSRIISIVSARLYGRRLMVEIGGGRRGVESLGKCRRELPSSSSAAIFLLSGHLPPPQIIASLVSQDLILPCLLRESACILPQKGHDFRCVAPPS